MFFCRFSSITHLLPIFLKKNYSLRQNILKNLRVWGRSLTSVPIGIYLDLIEVGTRLGIDSSKDFEELLKRSDRTLDRTLLPYVQSVHRWWTIAAKEWPDARTVFSLRPVRRWSCVRSSEEDENRIDRTLVASCQLGSTRPVATPGDLDLSGVDRTLGGSVRSLPPERSVSSQKVNHCCEGVTGC